MSDEPKRGSLGEFSAGDRAHGTHGKGDLRETRVDDQASEPANERAAQQGSGSGDPSRLKDKLTSELGDGAWGSAAAGDSSFDKRSGKNRDSGE